MNLYIRTMSYYAYLFASFKKSTIIPIERFTLKKFLWAISIVMTRQNPMPLSNSEKYGMALIPLLDMFNHKQFQERGGNITSFFDASKSYCVIQSPWTFQPGDQIYLDYGSRSNQDLFLFSGFFTEDIEYDKVKVPLSGVRPDDVLRKEKLDALCNMRVSL